MRSRRLLLAASGFLAVAWLGGPAQAQAPAALEEAASARLVKGGEEWALAVGQGLGHGLWGSSGQDAADVAFTGLVPRYGLGLSDPFAPNTWYRGNFELLLEGALFVATAPKGGFLGGASAVLRYNFLEWGRVVPFVELGAGVAWLELDLDSQSDGFSFTPQGGLGFHWWVSPRASLTASWRLHHLSNAGIGDDNVGVNDSLILVGFSYFP